MRYDTISPLAGLDPSFTIRLISHGLPTATARVNRFASSTLLSWHLIALRSSRSST